MGRYIAKRLLISLVVLFGASIIIFTLIHLQPGNPYSYMIDPNLPKEVTQEMLRKVGYYDPIYIKYLKWVSRVLVGDLGYSISYGRPVLGIISDKLFNTAILGAFSLVISVLIGIPVGIYMAMKRKGFVNYIGNFLIFLGISIPSFFIGLIFIKFFTYDIGLFPTSGMESLDKTYTGIAKYIDVIHHMILPAIVLSFVQIAALIKYTKSSMIDVIRNDYMRTARGKGLSFNKAIWVHGLKNAAIPIITVLCMQIPTLLSGALITESIFLWPGIGRLNYEAIMNRDYPLIMGVLLVVSIIILIFNLLADILYAVIDKRIKYN